MFFALRDSVAVTDSSPDSLPVPDDIQLSLASRMRVHLSRGAFATTSRKFTSRNQRHLEKPVQKGRDHRIPAFFPGRIRRQVSRPQLRRSCCFCVLLVDDAQLLT
jgi:hypothetical protein